MRTNLGIVFSCVFSWISASQAMAAPAVVIPNGGAGVGSLSVINPATGMIEHSLVTAFAPKLPAGGITNYSFAITNGGGSAAVIGAQPGATSAVYILSALNLGTGAITGYQVLTFIPEKSAALVAANPKASILYLGYGDQNGNFHIQALNPTSLHVNQESNLGSYGGQSMIVSPDGQTIYLIGSNAVVAVAASNLKLIGTVPLAVSFFNAAVSPDSATLYVTAGKYPDVTLAEIDAASLEQTASIPISEISVVFGLGISPDGSQLILSGQANFQGTDIFTLNLATQALTGVSTVVDGGVAVSPDGTAYVGDGSQVLVFDPVSQSVTGTLTAYGTGVFALNPTGSRLYYLNARSSTLAAAGPPPAGAIVGGAATGQLESTAYDAVHNLLLAADTVNNIEVLDAATFQPTGHLFLPNLDTTPPYLNASGGSGFVAMAGQVLRFDPVALQYTGRVSLPNSSNYLVGYSQTVMNGSTLYVPFSFSFNGGPIQFAGSSGDVPKAVPANGVWVIDTTQMKIVATWPFPALPLLGLAPGASVGYAVFPVGGQKLALQKIDLSTGKMIAQVEVPGASSFFLNPAVSPDGSTIYLISGQALLTFHAAALAQTSSTNGYGLASLTVSPDGAYLYGGTTPPCQACSEQIISTSSLLLVGTIPLSTAYAEPVMFAGN